MRRRAVVTLTVRTFRALGAFGGRAEKLITQARTTGSPGWAASEGGKVRGRSGRGGCDIDEPWSRVRRRIRDSKFARLAVVSRSIADALDLQIFESKARSSRAGSCGPSTLTG